MTLQSLLMTLNSPKVIASIYDAEGKTLISEIKASTHASLDDEIESKFVDHWEVISNTNIKIYLVTTV